MGKRGKIIWLFGLLMCMAVLLPGCSILNEDRVKLRDLEFVVLSEERIPEELRKVLEDKKQMPFQITYTDDKNLYICEGYGEQKTGGYSIAVEKLYLTEKQIIVDTCLLGPKEAPKAGNTPSYPYLVIRTELVDKPVSFE